MKLLLVLALAPLLGPIASGGADGIAWEAAFAEALARAKEERRVVFLAVNMDGERANDTLAREVYTARRIRELAAATVPLVASVTGHASGSVCPRFGAIPCSAHRDVDMKVRQEVLKPDADGWVVAPQHVFLGPDGGVLLSVPYEVGEAELEWCFVAAIRLVDPEFSWRLAPGAKAPQRLILGGVHEPEDGGVARILTREAVLERIAEVKKGTLGWDEREAAVREILGADEPEAIEFIRTQLRASSSFGGSDARVRILHQIGVHSPRSYWEVLAEWVDSGEPGPRAEAVVALEQLGAPEALKALQTALRKEKEPRIEKDLLRALGSAGAADKGVRALLLKSATKEKDPLLRRNAIVALGSLAPDEDVRATLAELLAESEDPRVRAAAACAVGLGRDASWQPALEAARDAAGDAALSEACSAALQVLRGGGLAPLRKPVRAVCEDTIERERLFGYAFD